MRHHEAGNTVPGGFYWNRATWEIVPVNGDSGVLPGEPGARYLKVPAVLLLVGAPLLGGLFVMFLPFIGIALVVRELARYSSRTFVKAGDELAVRLAPAWQPGVANLTGGKAAEKAGEAKDSTGPSELEGLEEKVAEVRRDEK